MTGAVPDILARIVAQKQQELRESKVSLSELRERASFQISGRRDFLAALRGKPVSIIAEVKKASPSKGLLTNDFRPADTARLYEEGGAAALSVLTDQRFFQGSLADLQAARSATSIPVLRKDFTIDEYHVVEAAASGADAILLIAAILDSNTLVRLIGVAASYHMTALVEVHNDEDLDRALKAQSKVIGVNNRNLHTFEVRLDTSLQLAERIPAGCFRISESGIETLDQIQTLQAAGYGAFLIGEHLMRSGDPVQALRTLTCS